MSLSLSQIVPVAQVQTMPVSDLLLKIIDAAHKGFKVYITSSAYSKLKPLFDKLGIIVREVGKITDSSYILIKVSGEKVKIIIFENNTKLTVRTTTMSAFEKALIEIIERSKGRPVEASSSKYYEIVFPEILKSIESSPEANGNGGDADDEL